MTVLDSLSDFRAHWKRPVIIVLKRLEAVLEMSSSSAVNSSIARRVAATIKLATLDRRKGRNEQLVSGHLLAGRLIAKPF